MEFIKYRSIENTYKESLLTAIRGEALSKNEQWVVTEKIHGSNFSFYISETDIKYAKRGSFLTKEESEGGFFQCNLVIEKHLSSMVELQKILHKREQVEYIVVYGEIYGGHYPHKNVPPSKIVSRPVQKGVWYTPNVEFIAFDVLCVNGESRKFLDYITFEGVCKEAGVRYLEALYVGSLEEALKVSESRNDSQTSIPGKFRLPPIHDNIREGNVLKPVVYRERNNGDRVIFKDKNRRFREKSGGKIKRHELRPGDYLTEEEIEHHLGVIKEYVTENRLNNAKSKIGSNPEFTELRNAFKKDVITEFRGENTEILQKKNIGMVFGKANEYINEFVRSKM